MQLAYITKSNHSRYWQARFCNRRGVMQNYTLRDFPRDAPKDQALAHATKLAAVEYVHFLHRLGHWRKLEKRGYDLGLMFSRLQDYAPHFKQRDLRKILEELHIRPADRNRSRARKRVVLSDRSAKPGKQYEFNGKSLTLREWSAECGISPAALQMRIRRGWSLEEAMNKPVMSQHEGGSIGADRRWRKSAVKPKKIS